MTEKKKKSKISEKDLIKKYENPKLKKDFKTKKEMYLAQTDRNYKDGDRN